MSLEKSENLDMNQKHPKLLSEQKVHQQEKLETVDVDDSSVAEELNAENYSMQKPFNEFNFA